jgi:hypothetical protein
MAKEKKAGGRGKGKIGGELGNKRRIGGGSIGKNICKGVGPRGAWKKAGREEGGDGGGVGTGRKTRK